MPLDLRELLDPAHTALVTQECQHGVIGDESILPELAKSASSVVPNIAALAAAARAAGVDVVHCIAQSRADRRGANTNARLFAAAAKGSRPMLPGTRATAVLDEIGQADSDLVIGRWHGLSPMNGTGLDPVLRNLGVKTIVGVGVSANVAIPSFVFDAVNFGYQFVLPRDAIAGVPEEYTDLIVDNTLNLLATIVTTQQVVDIWEAYARG